MSSRNERFALRVDGVDVEVAALRRDGGEPVVFLHGFGSTKEDYADFERHFADRAFLAYDAPGHGETVCDDDAISVPFLVRTARAVLDRAGIDRFHLVGHSMGGLTGLLLAHEEPDRVLSFVNIKGNLAPEDCFPSRQVITHPSAMFFDEFVERTRRVPQVLTGRPATENDDVVVTHDVGTP